MVSFKKFLFPSGKTVPRMFAMCAYKNTFSMHSDAIEVKIAIYSANVACIGHAFIRNRMIRA
jgi:hypothetical protein